MPARLRKFLIATPVALAISITACATPRQQPVDAAQQHSSESAGDEQALAVVRSTLLEAQAVAKAYGRANLGHYPDLDADALRAEGLAVPDGVDLTVQVDHHGFCVVTTTANLPSDHPWHRGSIATTSSAPQPGDGACAG